MGGGQDPSNFFLEKTLFTIREVPTAVRLSLREPVFFPLPSVSGHNLSNIHRQQILLTL
jgi:hypothetical protein